MGNTSEYKINEITAEYVTLKIPGAHGAQEYRAKVVRGDDKIVKAIDKLKIPVSYICLEAIKLNGNYITISANVNLLLSVALNDGYTEFTNCSYKPYKLPTGQVIAVVTCPNNATKMNRRESYRVFIGEETRCVRGLDNTIEKVVLVDLSNKGIGILFPKESGVAIRDRLMVSFTFKGIKYDLHGKVIRMMETDKGIRVGCLLVHELPQLNGILSQYQLQKRNAS